MCWHFEDQSITYPTPQWAAPCVLYGEGTGTLKVSPYYAEAGWFFDWRHGQFFSNGAFFYPSTAAFDDTYPAAQPNPYDGTHAYIPHSDVRLVLDQVQSCPGVLLKLVTHLKLAGKASAESGVYPVLTVVQSGRPHLVLLDSSGHIRLQDLSVQ